MREQVLQCIALILAAASLTGCSTASDWIRGEEPVQPADPEPVGVTLYLETMQKLAEGDPATQVEVFEEADHAYQRAPTTTNRLRLALALSTPGHPSSDPDEAQRLLTEVLATPETLLPAEKALAEVQLRELEQRLVLEAENRRLRETSAQAARDAEAVHDRQLRAAKEENRQLRKALSEAESKLEAVTSIERSIIERSDDGT